MNKQLYSFIVGCVSHTRKAVYAAIRPEYKAENTENPLCSSIMGPAVKRLRALPRGSFLARDSTPTKNAKYTIHKEAKT